VPDFIFKSDSATVEAAVTEACGTGIFLRENELHILEIPDFKTETRTRDLRIRFWLVETRDTLKFL